MAVDRDGAHGVSILGVLLADLGRNTEAGHLLGQAAAWGDPLAGHHLATVPRPHPVVESPSERR